VQQFRPPPDKASRAIAVIRSNRGGQRRRGGVCRYAFLQRGPVAKAVFASDDQLRVGKPKRRRCDPRIVSISKFWMPATNAIECFSVAFTPSVQQLAGFALWNIEMRPFRQAS